MARCSKTALFLIVLVQCGCATTTRSYGGTVARYYPHAASESLSMTSAEHRHFVEEMTKNDARALVEDLDLFFLTDRPTRLTRWHTR